MAHPIQKQWCENIRQKFPEYFKDKRVLDVGSLDVNGNNKYLFTNCEYVGLDVVPGKNVDVVCVAHEYESDPFDVTLSTNALEHDMYYKLTLQNMFKLLKPGGLMFFSVAYSWPEHGTKRTSPQNSGTSRMGKKWENYYKNLKPKDIEESLNLKEFEKHKISIFNKDLRFWGIKNEYRENI